MDDRQELLLAWLEGEGERHGRPVPLLSVERDPPLRALVHLLVCLFGAGLFFGILVCWLATARTQDARVTVRDQLRHKAMMWIAVGDPPDRSAWGKKEKAPVRSNGDDYWVLLCFWGGAIAFRTLFGAMCLCASGVLYNNVVGQGSPRRVPELVFGKAVVIAFVTALVNSVLGAGILAALAGLLVLAVLISAILPTTFARGVLVSLCSLLVATVVLVVLAVVIAGSALVRAHHGP